MTRARELAELASVYDSGALSNRNLIINGDFSISQRGDYSSATAISTATYYLDRWKTDFSGVSATIEHDAVDLPNGITTKSAKIAASSSASGYMQLTQPIETQSFMDNRKVTISAYVRSNNANTRIRVEGAVSGNFDGTAHTGGGGWELLKETITVVNSVSTFRTGVIMWDGSSISISSGDFFEIAHFQVEFGTEATPFEQRSFSDELLRCQRYYFQETGTATDASGRLGVASGAGTVVFDHTLPAQMRTKPSVALTSASLRIGDTVAAGFTTTSGTVTINTYSGSQSATYVLGGFSGLTSYRTYLHEPDSSNPGIVKFDAEL